MSGRGAAAMLTRMTDEPLEDDVEIEAEADAEAEYEDPGFKEGDEVWVLDADGNRHPGVFVGMNEAAGWFGGGPSAYVVHPDAHQAEVVSVYRILPRR